jgi:hypothetical protein
MTDEDLVILSEAKDPYPLPVAGLDFTVEGRGFSRATEIPKTTGFSLRERAI